MVGSFYDPTLDEGCAFEELISFHGGLGGPQTRGELGTAEARIGIRLGRRRLRGREAEAPQRLGRVRPEQLDEREPVVETISA